MTKAVTEDLEQPDVETFVIEHESKTVGAIQWQAEAEPDYLHASIDIYIDPAVHGRGIASDALRTLAPHLLVHRSPHRPLLHPPPPNPPPLPSPSHATLN